MYCSLVTDLEDELENAYNNGNIPMANVETAKTADMMKRAIAILTFGRELLGRKRGRETVETSQGCMRKERLHDLHRCCQCDVLRRIQTRASNSLISIHVSLSTFCAFLWVCRCCISCKWSIFRCKRKRIQIRLQ